jgi:hypothetical protein
VKGRHIEAKRGRDTKRETIFCSFKQKNIPVKMKNENKIFG